MTDDQLKLLQCPFCNNTAKLWEQYFEVRDNLVFNVYCNTPHCVQLGFFKTEEEAIEKWNRRV